MYSAYTSEAANDLPIPPPCIYSLSSQPAGSGFLGGTPSSTGGRIGFRVDHSTSGTGTQSTNGLYPRLYDSTRTKKPPTLSLAHHHLLWKSRLAGPFVSVWRSWTRALRWARYLSKKGCQNILIHIIDLDVIPKENTIFDAHLIVQELHRRGRGHDLDEKNHWEELLILNGVDQSCNAVLGTLPAGSDNLKIKANFANVLVPRELWDEVEKTCQTTNRYNEEVARQQEAAMYYASPVSAPTVYAPSGSGTAVQDWTKVQYSPSVYSSYNSPSSSTEDASSVDTSLDKSPTSASETTSPSTPASDAPEEDDTSSSKDSTATKKPLKLDTNVESYEPIVFPDSAFLPSQTPISPNATLFETFLFRLYTDMRIRRGYVDSLKLMELVIAMCTDFSAVPTDTLSSSAADVAPTAADDQKESSASQRNPQARRNSHASGDKRPGPRTPYRLRASSAASWRSDKCFAGAMAAMPAAKIIAESEEGRKRKDSIWTNGTMSTTASPVRGRGHKAF